MPSCVDAFCAPADDYFNNPYTTSAQWEIVCVSLPAVYMLSHTVTKALSTPALINGNGRRNTLRHKCPPPFKWGPSVLPYIFRNWALFFTDSVWSL